MDGPLESPREIALARSSSSRKINELSLVLRAVGIDHTVRPEGIAFALYVADRDLERARAELVGYERENVGFQPRRDLIFRATDWVTATIAYCGTLIAIHLFAVQGALGFDWVRAGAADGQAMRDGQWWRAITALSLHSGIAHLLGNLLFGSFFGAILAHSLGAGLAWTATLFAGALGFALEAAIRPEFASIGASTAVFGALGAQVAYQWRLRRVLNVSAWRVWAPVFGGLVLLGYLGISDPGEGPAWMQREAQRIDVIGHATGFLGGVAIGGLLGRPPRGVQLGARAQIALGLLAPLTLTVAWVLALSAS